jgi:exosortase F-associated protein
VKKLIEILGFIIGVCCLAAIRYFEKSLFYDPLNTFYHGDFLDNPFPNLDFWIYSLNIGFRYILNTIISLLLIWIVFKSKNYLKFSVLLFILLFVIGLALFWIVKQDIVSEHYMRLFYIRRFLIQPILVIILIPAFYFQQLNKKASE